MSPTLSPGMRKRGMSNCKLLSMPLRTHLLLIYYLDLAGEPPRQFDLPAPGTNSIA